MSNGIKPVSSFVGAKRNGHMSKPTIISPKSSNSSRASCCGGTRKRGGVFRGYCEEFGCWEGNGDTILSKCSSTGATAKTFAKSVDLFGE